MREMKRVKTIGSEITKKKHGTAFKRERVRERLTIIKGGWADGFAAKCGLEFKKTTSLGINWYGPEQMTMDMVRNERDPRTVRSEAKAS